MKQDKFNSDPAGMVCFQLYSASHAFTRFYRPLLAPLGLTYPQYLVLLSLRGNKNETISGLGKKLFLDSNTLSPLIKRLEKMGLLIRQRSKEDERVVTVSLTKKGEDLSDKAYEIRKTLENCIDLPNTDLHQLLQQLDVLRNTLIAQKG